MQELAKQNKSTEGCSKLKRPVDMTSSGKNGLNIRTNASPKKGQDQVSGVKYIKTVFCPCKHIKQLLFLKTIIVQSIQCHVASLSGLT